MPLPNFARLIASTTLGKAEQVNVLYDEAEKIALGALLADYAHTETISATETLTDASEPIQRLTPSGANRDVALPTVAATNHPFYITNPTGSSYSLVVKSGATTLATLAAGETALVISDGVAWSIVYVPPVIPARIVLKQVLVMTSSGTFTKASYPGLYAINVKLAAGGGGGGGVAGSAGAAGCGNGGGGGEYAEKFILATDLPSSVSVTIGAGGSGGAAGNNAGGNGGTTFFGALFTALGGAGGTGQNATASVPFTGTTTGGTGGSGGTGTADIRIPGADSTPGTLWTTANIISSVGGGNPLAPPTRSTTATSTDEDGVAGRGYGGAGCGARVSNINLNHAGGAGAAGVCIIEIYAEI